VKLENSLDEILNENINNLPPNWTRVKLAEICKTTSGGTPSRSNTSYYRGNIPWLKSGELEYNIVNSSEEHITRDAIENSSSKIIERGTILMALYGATVGKLAILGIDAAINQAICAIFTPNGIENKFLYWYLFGYRHKLLNSRKGGAQPNISQQIVNDIIFPLPPLNEQKRIVSKLEELFTQLDAGMEYLKKTKIMLKQYRQSILKYAFNGKLTEKWRHENKTKIEKELFQMKSEIDKKSHNNKFKNYVSDKNIKELPSPWIWMTLSEVCDKIQDGSHFSPKIQYDSPGKNRFLYITAKNIKENGLDLSELTYVDNDFHAEIFSRCDPKKGDVLLIKDGVKTGIATINTLDEPFSLLSSVALFKPSKGILNANYLKHYLNSPVGFIMTTNQMTGTAIKRIILQKIRLSLIPLTGISEQQEISERLESYLSRFDYALKITNSNLVYCKNLRNSILKNAFSGKLVPQDPNDESAEILLERINQVRPEIGSKLNSKRIRNKSNQRQMRFV
jgi:type I restriction enzyme S subunit